MLLPSWCPLIASRLPEPTDNPRAVSSRRSSALRFPVPLSHRSPAAAPRRSLPFALARRAPLYSSRSTWPSFPLSAGKAPPSNWHSDVPAPEHAARARRRWGEAAPGGRQPRWQSAFWRKVFRKSSSRLAEGISSLPSEPGRQRPAGGRPAGPRLLPAVRGPAPGGNGRTQATGGKRGGPPPPSGSLREGAGERRRAEAARMRAPPPRDACAWGGCARARAEPRGAGKLARWRHDAARGT